MDINLITKMTHIAVEKIDTEWTEITDFLNIHNKVCGVYELANTMIWEAIDEGHILMSDGFRAIDALNAHCFHTSPSDE